MILPRQSLTADEFAEIRPDLPEGGRWHELHKGKPVLLEAPDDAHGTTVLNISRALGIWFQQNRDRPRGYACYGPGLVAGQNPDTVFLPSLMYFDEGPVFGQSDLPLATLVPKLVVDVASTNDRRRLMRERTIAYLKLGVEVVWVPDPFKMEVQVVRRTGPTLALGKRQSLDCPELLPKFSMPVADVFAQPKWWTGS